MSLRFDKKVKTSAFESAQMQRRVMRRGARWLRSARAGWRSAVLLLIVAAFPAGVGAQENEPDPAMNALNAAIRETGSFPGQIADPMPTVAVEAEQAAVGMELSGGLTKMPHPKHAMDFAMESDTMDATVDSLRRIRAEARRCLGRWGAEGFGPKASRT